MAAETQWEEWAPEYAPHVKGRYERRTWDGAGLPLAQKIECTCTACGGRYETACTTGQVRAHIARFAAAHLHADPLAMMPPVVR